MGNYTEFEQRQLDETDPDKLIVGTESRKKVRRAFSISESEFSEHADSYDGVCIDCHEWTCGGVEPDARGYDCENCGKPKVYGAEEALMMDYLSLTEED